MATSKSNARKMMLLLPLLSATIVCAAAGDETFEAAPTPTPAYEIPQPKFKLLAPSGFQASIPDEPGIRLFAFHGNVNKKMEKMGSGQHKADIVNKEGGRWIFRSRKQKLYPGDVIYYWVFVIKNGIGYRMDDGYYEITETDVNRIAKKAHKLRKRSPYGLRTYYHNDDDDQESDYNQGFGGSYGQGYGQHRYHQREPTSWMHGQHHHHHHHRQHGHYCPWQQSGYDNDSDNENSDESYSSNTYYVNSDGTADVDHENFSRWNTRRPTTTTTRRTTTTSEPKIDLRFGEGKDQTTEATTTSK